MAKVTFPAFIDGAMAKANWPGAILPEAIREIPAWKGL